MTGRRILVTGATGGLGQAIVREALSRGHTVRASGRSQAAGATLTKAGAEFIGGDLEGSSGDLAKLVRGCDSVIHAAALSASWGPRRAFVAANIDVTRGLLAAASGEGVRRFVFVSSPSIFAAFRDRLDIGPDDDPNPTPLNDYARTKFATERLALASNTARLAVCAIRPRALVGEGDRVILPRLAELASRARMPLPRGGAALIELTDLRDAARAICEAEERALQIAGRAINISDGRPRTVRTVAQQLAQALGKTPRLASIPLPVARALAEVSERVATLFGAAKEPVLTRYTLATLGYSQTFDLGPARELLGYEPRHDALETLLAQARLLRSGSQ